MRGGNLTLAIALIGVGGLLVWVGFSDPPGGLFAVVANAMRGKSSKPAAPGAAPATAAAPHGSAPASTPVPGTRVRAQ